MEATIKEIAALLRSTEPMAAQFVQRVQNRVGQPVSDTEILAIMKKIPAKSLSMEKVVIRLRQRKKRTDRQTSQRQTVLRPKRANADPTTSAPASTARPRDRKTILERLESVLQRNWDRAETEGLQPKRMAADAFVSAIYQHTDRQEGTRRRILQAARQLDQDDVMLTPALVADAVHKIFES